MNLAETLRSLVRRWPILVVGLLLAAGAVTSSRYVGSSWPLQCLTTAWISLSVTHEPCTRTGFDAPIGRNRPSP